MKMKKVLAVFFCVLVLMCNVVPAFSAAEQTENGYIYFAVPTSGAVAWKNFKMVYCHMWSKNGGDVYGWQEKKERCEDMGNGYWRYDLSAITFEPEGEYSLIFSNEIGSQTYNLNITSACLGDIVYCDGSTVKNPVDGEKTCAVARWKNHSDTVHPALELDSNGITVNIDEIDPAEAQTVWGSDEGGSYEMEPLVTEEKTEKTEETSADADKIAAEKDGLDTSKVTMWIIIVCAVLACAIAAVVIYLSKKNKKN